MFTTLDQASSTFHLFLITPSRRFTILIFSNILCSLLLYLLRLFDSKNAADCRTRRALLQYCQPVASAPSFSASCPCFSSSIPPTSAPSTSSPANSEMADFAESGDEELGTVNHVPGDFGPCEGKRETSQVSLSVGVVVNVQGSQIRDPWLGEGTPFGSLVKS